MTETLEEKIHRLNQESTSIEPYNPVYIGLFLKEKEHLFKCLPSNLITRIEHFGSTAIPSIPSKPIIDILVEVNCLKKTQEQIVPELENQGYDYLWRPTTGDESSWYAWFIKRDSEGKRTHHIHMVEKDSTMWKRLYFRDYLIKFPDEAKKYGDLKLKLSREFPNDRSQYTHGKTELIKELTWKALNFFKLS